jgi:predicted phage tail protein
VNLRAEPSSGQVTLTWDVSAGTPAFAGFSIEVGTALSLSNLGSFDTGSTALRYIAPQPPPGVYFVRVRARNAFGSSPPSNEVSVQVVGTPASACQGPPAAPVGLTSTVAATFVTLSWINPITATPTTGYRLDVGSGSGLSNLLQLGLGSATAFSGVAPPGVYFARIRAVNACGLSGPSNEIVVSIP